jgi:hypothetical protein
MAHQVGKFSKRAKQGQGRKEPLHPPKIAQRIQKFKDQPALAFHMV